MANLSPFDDARLLYERARLHISEFNKRRGLGPAGPWQIRSSQNSHHECALIHNRTALRTLKPVLGDAANNIVHALDHITAVFARRIDAKRNWSLQFPKSANDCIFNEQLEKIEKDVGPEAAKLIKEVREDAKPMLRHVDLMRELSNSAKHWELTTTTTSADAIAFNVIGKGQEIVQIPKGHFLEHDEFVFWKSATPIPSNSVSIVIGFRLEGLTADNLCDPGTHLDNAANYVHRMIEASEKLIGWTAASAQ